MGVATPLDQRLVAKPDLAAEGSDNAIAQHAERQGWQAWGRAQ
jgi:hypothetical protein